MSIKERPDAIDILDPDALDDLFRPAGRFPRGEGTPKFAIHGYEVTVVADGEIVRSPHGDETLGGTC